MNYRRRVMEEFIEPVSEELKNETLIVRIDIITGEKSIGIINYKGVFNKHIQNILVKELENFLGKTFIK